MSSEERREHHKMDAGQIKELLGVVSTEVPAMIKSIMTTIFSEEAGRNMGKAAAAYYKELKAGGLPDDVAVKLTQEYMQTFTNIGQIFRGMGRGPFGGHGRHGGPPFEKEEE